MKACSLVDQIVHSMLVLCEYRKERIPFGKLVTLRRIQRRIHWHQIPKLIIHDKRPWNKMINIILLCDKRLTRKDIAYFSYFQNAFPKFTYVIQLSHLLIHRSKHVDQARNLRIIILQPFHFFVLNPSKNIYRIVLNHPHPIRIEMNFLFQFTAVSEGIRQTNYSTIDSPDILS